MNRLHSFFKALLVGLICFCVFSIALHFSQDFRSMAYHVRDDVIMARLIPIAPKFWAHRCNDTRKMKEMIAKFDGVELDIIFYPTADGGFFEVSHDYQTSPEHPLDDFFALLAPQKKTKCWLDFKNLDKTTVQSSLRELERLVAKYQIDKKRLIVESGNYVCLGIFHAKGYYTSYYCPVNDERYLRTDAHKEEYMHIVNDAVKSGNVDAVSFDVEYYPLVKTAGTNADLLAWHVGNYSWWEFSFDRKLKPLLEDSQVKVILVSKHSRYNRT